MHNNTHYLAIVSSCVKGKNYHTNDSCMLANCEGETISEIASYWFRNIQEPSLPRDKARDMYKGRYWNEIKETEEIAKRKGFIPSLWVLSAGWGFISADSEISSYSATFTAEKYPENAVRNLPWPSEYSLREKSSSWWEEIHKKRNMPGSPRLRDLPKQFPDSDKLTILIIVGPDYFHAIQQELLELTGGGIDVIIVSSGLTSELSNANILLHDFILPFNKKFEKEVNKFSDKQLYMAQFNSKLAKYLVDTCDAEIRGGVKKVYSKINRIEKSLPALQTKKPRPVSEEELDVIQIGLLKQYPHISKKEALRIFRNEMHLSREENNFWARLQFNKNKTNK